MDINQRDVYESMKDNLSTEMIRSTVKCDSCAHKEYCEVGAECSNEGCMSNV